MLAAHAWPRAAALGNDARQAQRRAHQREVGKRLREISSESLCPDVVFLGKQAQIIGDRERALEAAASCLVSSLHPLAVGELKGAGQKGALWTVLLRLLAVHQAIHNELPLNRFNCL